MIVWISTCPVCSIEIPMKMGIFSPGKEIYYDDTSEFVNHSGDEESRVSSRGDRENDDTSGARGAPRVWSFHDLHVNETSESHHRVCVISTRVTSLMWSSIETSQAMVLETCHTEQNNWVVMTSSLSSSVMREMFTFTRANTKITDTFISRDRRSQLRKGIHKIGLFRANVKNTSDCDVPIVLHCYGTALFCLRRKKN